MHPFITARRLFLLTTLISKCITGCAFVTGPQRGPFASSIGVAAPDVDVGVDSASEDPKIVRGDKNWRKQAPGFVFRTLKDVREAGRAKVADTKTWESRRYLTRDDGFGFSFHHTILRKGESTLIHYKNHVEAVLVVSGSGEIELCHEGQEEGEGFVVLKLEPGTLYGLGGQERHYLRADPSADMHVACAFNPPIDGAEDHDDDGVYPAIGEDGIPRYSYGEEAVPLLFKPAESLEEGSLSNTAAPSSISGPRITDDVVQIRQAKLGDGKAMWQLAKDAGLDLNSYMYNLFCRQFAKTCAIAVAKPKDGNKDDEGRIVAYTVAYQPPPSEEDDSDSPLFIWQIGVHPQYRQRGIGLGMLNFLADDGASSLQATVTDDNEVSQKLFGKFAAERSCDMRIVKDWISVEQFPPNDQHASESLFVIGPFGGQKADKDTKFGPTSQLLETLNAKHGDDPFFSQAMKPNSESDLTHIAHNPALVEMMKHESNARTYVRRFPFIVAKADGCELTDTDGNKYLDFLGCAGTLALGHNHPVQNGAILSHIESKKPLQQLDFATTAKEKFVKQLFEFLPDRFSDYRVQFCGAGGSDAVDAAIKLCKFAHGGTRTSILAFDGAYHGMGQGPLAMMGDLGPKEGLPGLATGIHFLPFPKQYRQPFGLSSKEGDEAVMHYIQNVLGDGNSGVTKPAAVVIEIIQGEGGVNSISNEALQKLSALMKQHDIPLIVDEVQTGFCRTGRKFAFERAGITPDVVVLSKAVGGSQPLACIIYKPELDKWAPGSHAGTFRGNGLAFSAGAATLKYMNEVKLWEKVDRLGNIFQDKIKAAQSEYIGDVRGSGLMVGMELVDPKQKCEDGFPKASGDLCAQTQVECLKRGLIIEKGGRDGAVLRPLPPLIVTEEQVNQAADIILESIAAAAKEVF